MFGKLNLLWDILSENKIKQDKNQKTIVHKRKVKISWKSNSILCNNFIHLTFSCTNDRKGNLKSIVKAQIQQILVF
jgi:hypothetical protein